MSHLPPDVQLERLANAHQLSRAVQVAARLQLGRLLEAGPRSLRELAETTASDEAVLRRLLELLAHLHVIEVVAEDRFGPTPLSARLHLVDNIAQGDEAWQAWGALPEALRTGRPSFPRVHGEGFYAYAARHPELAGNWRETNMVRASGFAPAIAAALPLRGDETLADVGGGQGVLLSTLLRQHPGCRGILFDLHAAVCGAAESFASAGLTDRCEVVAGDALEGVPAGADVYLLCRVLSNLPDPDAVAALAACRRAMGAAARLLVVDALMPEPGEAGRTAFAGADLHHFLLWGGGYRTARQLGRLLEEAGLTVEERRSTADGAWSVLDCRCRVAALP